MVAPTNYGNNSGSKWAVQVRIFGPGPLRGDPSTGYLSLEQETARRKHYRSFRFCFPACIGCTILAGINPAAQPSKCCCRDCRGSRQRLPRYRGSAQLVTDGWAVTRSEKRNGGLAHSATRSSCRWPEAYDHSKLIEAPEEQISIRLNARSFGFRYRGAIALNCDDQPYGHAESGKPSKIAVTASTVSELLPSVTPTTSIPSTRTIKYGFRQSFTSLMPWYFFESAPGIRCDSGLEGSSCTSSVKRFPGAMWMGFPLPRSPPIPGNPTRSHAEANPYPRERGRLASN